MASSLRKGQLRKMADRLCCCFEVVEDEEMEIGSPTDVKHVAHIGWDGPSANGPTWVRATHSVSSIDLIFCCVFLYFKDDHVFRHKCSILRMILFLVVCVRSKEDLFLRLTCPIFVVRVRF